MTKEEFDKIPFHFESHISQKSEHIVNYISEGGIFGLARITPKNEDDFGETRFGEARILYRIWSKWYDTEEAFLEALEKL